MGANGNSHPRRFGNRLRACRDHAEFSQKELGEIAALHPTEICLLERGEREPQLSTIIKFASALEVPSISSSVESTGSRLSPALASSSSATCAMCQSSSGLGRRRSSMNGRDTTHLGLKTSGGLYEGEK
jgi:transcriptional regulator with XRE-family HTH domain